jgi:hypothetical protein
MAAVRHWTERWTLWSWCRRCGRTIWTVPWRNAYCRDFERCIHDEWVQAIESVDWIYSESPQRAPEGWGLTTYSHWVEPGPIEFEQPPEDIEACSRCKGSGEVLREDWEMGPVWEACRRCDMTGVDPSLCPA